MDKEGGGAVRIRFYPEFGFKGSLGRGVAEADQTTTVCVTVCFLDPNHLIIQFRNKRDILNRVYNMVEIEPFENEITYDFM